MSGRMLAELIALLKNRTDQRSALTDLGNTTLYSANNAVTTVASAPANGARVAMACAELATDTTAFNSGELNIGSLTLPLFQIGGSGRIAAQLIKNLKTPNGVNVAITSTSVNITAYAHAENL